MSDQTIHCPDCKADFVFTTAEQEFYAEKGFQTPKRCKPCREERKLRKAQQDAGQEPRTQPASDEYRPQKARKKGGRRDNHY